MKSFLLVMLILLSFNSFAQEASCTNPTYFPGISSLLKKRMPDVLIGLQEDSTLKFHHCFRGDSDNPDWVFLAYRSDTQQITFVFVQDRVNMILVDGDPCPCLKEFEYLKKWWVQQGDRAKYLNKSGEAEAIIDISNEPGCMSIKVHQ